MKKKNRAAGRLARQQAFAEQVATLVFRKLLMLQTTVQVNSQSNTLEQIASYHTRRVE